MENNIVKVAFKSLLILVILLAVKDAVFNNIKGASKVLNKLSKIEKYISMQYDKDKAEAEAAKVKEATRKERDEYFKYWCEKFRSEEHGFSNGKMSDKDANIVIDRLKVESDIINDGLKNKLIYTFNKNDITVFEFNMDYTLPKVDYREKVKELKYIDEYPTNLIPEDIRNILTANFDKKINRVYLVKAKSTILFANGAVMSNGIVWFTVALKDDNGRIINNNKIDKDYIFHSMENPNFYITQ